VAASPASAGSPRVLFLIRSLNAGGAERQLVTLASELATRGAEVHVALFYGGGVLHRELAHDAQVTIHDLRKNGRWDAIGLLWRFGRVLRRVKPQFVHGYLPDSNLIVLLARAVLPSSRVIWGVRASYMDLTQFDWLARMVFRVTCVLSRFAHLIIFNSSAGRDYHFAHGYRPAKAIVIPNGFDVDVFRPDRVEGAAFRREVGIPANDRVIGIAGRIDPMKDHLTFVRAAGLLALTHPQVRFLIVGDGRSDLRVQVEHEARRLDIDTRLVWAGHRQDMRAAYNGMDVATSSSIGEGFSNVIGEAMACGVACVVTDVGDSGDLVGETGLCVAARDPSALAAAWRTILDGGPDELSRRGVRARARIMEFFSIRALGGRVSAALADVQRD
jgi:glycosyltransferase involved in cell wall biosynthesis